MCCEYGSGIQSCLKSGFRLCLESDTHSIFTPSKTGTHEAVDVLGEVIVHFAVSIAPMLNVISPETWSLEEKPTLKRRE